MGDRKVWKDKKFDNTSNQEGFGLPRFENVTTEPVKPAGYMGYNLPDQVIYFSDGLTWVPCSANDQSRVFLTTNITGLTTGSVIKYDTVEFDSGIIYSAATGLFTIPTTGLYAISSATYTQSYSSGGGSSIANIEMWINSTHDSSVHHLINVSGTPFTFYREVNLTMGDTVCFKMDKDGGSATATVIGLISTTGKGTWASVRRIG